MKPFKKHIRNFQCIVFIIFKSTVQYLYFDSATQPFKGDGCLITGVFCADTGSNSNASSCRGDSGGPAVRQEERFGRQVYTLVGINSFSSVNCRENKNSATGFANVFNYLPWIKETVKRG